MIHRFICHLLISLMLANQGLCFAHAHPGSAGDEPGDHAGRPHIHLSGEGHHHAGHSHDACHCDAVAGESQTTSPPAVSLVYDHDSDAMYLPEPATLARVGNKVIVPKLSDSQVTTIVCDANEFDDLLSDFSRLRGRPTPDFGVTYPIYLRTLSLRI